MRPELAPAFHAVDGAQPSPADLWVARLKRDGYCIIRQAIGEPVVAGLADDLAERFARTPFCAGVFYGDNTKRFGGVLKRSAHAEAFVRHPLILQIVEALLGPWCDRFQLNLTQALQIYPGQGPQPAHRDENMWGGPKGQMEYLVNVMWPLGPYRAENGATMVYPGTHNGGPHAGAGNEGAPLAVQPVFAEMDPGDVLLFLGSTLHGGGANRTAAPRTGMIVSYSLGWLKPYENQWLVYPPDVARTFSPELAALAGYRQHRPNLGNYEGRCPSILLNGEPDAYLGAVDELLPRQVAALEARRAAIAASGSVAG